MLRFFAVQPACIVAMEACASADYWARGIAKLGHTTRLIAAHYVKPFVKRQKNDAADAEAICEAAQRPTMRFVTVKSEEKQASAVVFRTRDLLVRQRTQVINACNSLASVGKVMFLGCTVVSTVTRARSRVRNAPLACATRRLSAKSSSSLSPSRFLQWLRSERSCGKACWKNSSPVKCWKYGS